ncbi:hypothetical protein ACIQZI_03180 [Peribacillus sp. NPDC096379]|uniref:DUF7852 domain-containing protein n=1 Tax=Peribacillus sp. NPDC096379 TaxID=3364393 RepID=UPI00380C932A
MKTPWVNSTKMQEIISRQINIVNSSRVQIESPSTSCGKNKDFTVIKIDCRLSNHIPSLCVSDEGDEFNGNSLPETIKNSFDSPACISIEQPSEIEPEAKDNSVMNITEPTNDQQNFQADVSNYSPTEVAFDSNDPSGSNLADEKHKIFNRKMDCRLSNHIPSLCVSDEGDEFNENSLPETINNSFDSPACISIEQPSEIEPEAKDNSVMNITEPTNDQQNFQADVSNYSPTEVAFDSNDPSGSNLADEKHKIFNRKMDCRLSNHIPSLCVSDEGDEFNENSLPETINNSFDSPACISIEQPSEIEPEAKDNSVMDTTEPTNDQQNFQADVSNYSPTEVAFDSNDPSGSNLADEKHKIFNRDDIDEDLYEDDSLVVPVHDSPVDKSEEKNNQSSTSFDFVNIRVPVVVGEYKIEICLEEAVLFEENIMWINVISNKVVLSNSKFIPTQFSEPLKNGMSKALKGNLFIEGYIIQNIEYTAAKQDLETDPLYKDGKIYLITKKRPFSTIVEINNFLHPPVFGAITQKTFDFFDPNNKEVPQTNTKLFNNVTYYPEQPYCRLIFSEIHEHTSLSDTVHENYNHTPIESVQVNPIHTKKEANEKQLAQKTVLVTFVHLLQEQSVRVRYDNA